MGLISATIIQANLRIARQFDFALVITVIEKR
jgi:hypothetical protein